MEGQVGGEPADERLMTLRRDDRGGCAVLTVCGEVDLATEGRLVAAARDALRERRPLILDLSEVGFLSSSGMGRLVAISEEARTGGSPLRLAVAQNRRVIHPLTVMGLDRLLLTFPTVAEAVTD